MNYSFSYIIRFLLFTIIYLMVFYYPLQRVLALMDHRDSMTLQIIAYILLLLPFIGTLMMKVKETITTRVIGTISMLWLG
ncbi:MAG: hypothetical protein VX028_04105 [Nanoarchaeota archaeon]|nr:hypothetical protein [Nanoarchaeota archaeon]